jgi:D-glycero-alpha-D-manno-heptose 1-phosphate guanylyltransferase
MIREAILLAGGFGTRLQKAVPGLPKPLAPVNGKPFIEYIMDFLIRQRINKFILSVGYKHEEFAHHFTNDYCGCPVLLSVEFEPLGTGGGIRKAMKFADDAEIFVVNADTIFRIDVQAMHTLQKKTGADITIALKHKDDVKRYGSVEVNAENRVTGFFEKQAKTGAGYINGGIYLLRNDFFEKHPFPEKFSFEKDCLEPNYNTLKICGYPSRGYFLDIGIPEDYEKAKSELQGS